MNDGRKYWIPEIETAPLEKLREIQLKKIQDLTKKVYEKSVYYKKRFDEVGVKPEDIQSLDDYDKFPMTEYTQDISAEELLSVPLDDIKMVLSSSGTTGQPKLIYINQSDIENWKLIFARFSAMYGLEKGDVVDQTFPFPTIGEGFSFPGARVVAYTHTTMVMDNLIRLMARAGTTFMLSAPGYFLMLLKRADEIGIDLRKIGMRRGVLAGESWSQSYRKRMEDDMNMKFYDLYGMVEVGHPAGECLEQNGMHTWDDLYIFEIIDPDTLKPLPDGVPGEIVLTPLWRDAMPLIRYRTGDVAFRFPYEQCPCGRTFQRISRIKGRIAHMVKIGEARIFPVDVEEVIQSIPKLSGEYQIILNKPNVQDLLEVKAECSSGVEITSDLTNRLTEELNRSTGVKSKVNLIEFGGFSRGPQLKAERILKNY